MRCYIVWRNRMASFISKIWIMLPFEQRLRKGSVGLVHSHQSGAVGKLAVPDLETCSRCNDFHTSGLQDIYQGLRILRRFDQETKKLAWPLRPYRFLAN